MKTELTLLRWTASSPKKEGGCCCGAASHKLLFDPLHKDTPYRIQVASPLVDGRFSNLYCCHFLPNIDECAAMTYSKPCTVAKVVFGDNAGYPSFPAIDTNRILQKPRTFLNALYKVMRVGAVILWK